MNPIDYRLDTWNAIQDRLNAKRRAVLAALQAHGPCTTRELAERMEWDILCVRPRVTELCQLGFAEIDENAPRVGHEGVYRALSEDEALATFNARSAAARTTEAAQPELKLAV